MINVENLTVELNSIPVIKDLTFNLPGGVLSILGLNGIGKTTLLKSIAGLIKIKSGNVVFEDCSLHNLSRQAYSKIVSFVPQEFSSIFDFSVKEMILFGRAPYIKAYNAPKKIDFDIINEVMSEMNILKLKNRRFNELSGGERKLVLISMALAQQTQILLLDEPTTFLDINNSSLILKHILKLSHIFNKLVIITLHDINQAIHISDKMLILLENHEYLFGNTNEMVTKEYLDRLFSIEYDVISLGNNKKFIIPKIN